MGVRVKIVLYGINSKMADVALTSLLLAAPHIYCNGGGNSQNTIQVPRRSVISISVCSRFDFPTNV